MYRKILVPINPLEDQELLIKTASDLGIEQNAIVCFVYFGKDQNAITKLEEHVKNCRELGLNVKYKSIIFDGQEKEIPKEIAKLSDDYDLIVMGHLKFDKIYRFVHHSTAADLINLVSIPVMVIPDEGNSKFILDKY
jgi:nucleotide-binding universal stress UspA family protein